jgi:hypothetical protein
MRIVYHLNSQKTDTDGWRGDDEKLGSSGSLVVQAARRALAERDLSPVLAYVPREAEAELRMEFEETLRVRKLGEGAREVYDYLFCETALRLHREGSRSDRALVIVAQTS